MFFGLIRRELEMVELKDQEVDNVQKILYQMKSYHDNSYINELYSYDKDKDCC